MALWSSSAIISLLDEKSAAENFLGKKLCDKQIHPADETCHIYKMSASFTEHSMDAIWAFNNNLIVEYYRSDMKQTFTPCRKLYIHFNTLCGNIVDFYLLSLDVIYICQ